MASLKGSAKQVLLVILDGFGISETTPKNAIKDANTPNLDKLFSEYPFRTITGGGEEVGLPKGVVGNSEVGHLNLGAGRPVRQDLVRINEAIEKKTLASMPQLQDLITKTKNGNGRLHIMGLLSDGGVHSHIEHIKTLLNIFNEEKITPYFHAFMDGRDTPVTNGKRYIEELVSSANFTFASMQGRSIGMDRDRRWEKIEHALSTMTGKGEITSQTPGDYIQSQYDKKITDEFITPVLFNKESAIQSGDTVFFINFRPDRARQITLAMNDPEFNHFEPGLKLNSFLCMTPYVEEELPELPILFDKEKVKGGISEYLSGLGKKQFKIAETEKYAHVTYFFNGGEKKPFPGEEHFLIPSPKEVSTYDEKPEMSAYAVTEKLEAILKEKDISFFLVNYANSDMVGHTGNYQAAVKAIEVLDECVGRILKVCEQENISMLLTADHGNSDQMVYENGEPHTSHTGSPCPLSLFHPSLKGRKDTLHPGDFALKDLAPSVLHLLGIEAPASFTGKSLII